MRRVMLGTALVLALAAPAFAADKQTLADIRAELAQVSAQLQELRSELVASGASGLQAAGGASALQRMDTMEAELTRLTAMTEQLKDRVDKVVKDGTNRVGDLEFRVCELEEGCDPASVGQAQPLGGAAPAAAAAAAPAASGGAASSGGTMAMNDFKKNFWDKYEGYDMDKDKVGDVPFHPLSLYSVLVENNPSIMLLFKTFFVDLLDKTEKIIPSLTPENFVDEQPLMKKVEI